ncbi:MAG TPA: ribosome maturation factor RimM [Ktedonobacteraceae bacterium]|nr:ribosome maturation factor RimM [Ktedonobacteraceae bacterium]
MSEQQQTEWATIGKVVALFGVRGELKVRLLTDVPNRFEQLDVIYVGEERRSYPIESVRPYKGEMILLKLRGLRDANAAESLRNADLTIPLSRLAELPAGSYYQHDIIGLRVFTLDETYLGTIVDIISTGSNDVYVVKKPDLSQVLIPAIKDVIKQIDLQKHVMHIDPMPGLLDNSDRDLREEADAALE